MEFAGVRNLVFDKAGFFIFRSALFQGTRGTPCRDRRDARGTRDERVRTYPRAHRAHRSLVFLGTRGILCRIPHAVRGTHGERVRSVRPVHRPW